MKKKTSKTKMASIVVDEGTGNILGVFTSDAKCIKAMQELVKLAVVTRSGRTYNRIDLPVNQIK